MQVYRHYHTHLLLQSKRRQDDYTVHVLSTDVTLSKTHSALDVKTPFSKSENLLLKFTFSQKSRVEINVTTAEPNYYDMKN